MFKGAQENCVFCLDSLGFGFAHWKDGGTQCGLQGVILDGVLGAGGIDSLEPPKAGIFTFPAASLTMGVF